MAEELGVYNPTIKQNWTPEKVRPKIPQRLRSLLFAAAIVVASYLFISALTYEDREGDRTLSWFSPLVMLLRGLGRLVAQNAELIFVNLLLFPLLGVGAALTLVLL